MRTNSTEQLCIEILLAGGSIRAYAGIFHRLCDANGNPIRSFYRRSFEKLLPILRRDKRGCYVLNKSAVRQLHGNHFAKKLYKKLNHDTSHQSNTNTGSGPNC